MPSTPTNCQNQLTAAVKINLQQLSKSTYSSCEFLSLLFILRSSIDILTWSRGLGGGGGRGKNIDIANTRFIRVPYTDGKEQTLLTDDYSILYMYWLATHSITSYMSPTHFRSGLVLVGTMPSTQCHVEQHRQQPNTRGEPQVSPQHTLQRNYRGSH